MTVANPYNVPGMNPSGVTVNPRNLQLGDTTPSVLGMGRHGEQLVSPIHGSRYVKASRSNLFWGTSGVAGSKFIAPGQTTGSFMLFNPPTSGVVVEVERFMISGASTETDVIAGLALEGSVQTPTGTLTGCTVSTAPFGSSLGALTATAPPAAKVYGVATIAAMTFLGSLGLTITATTSPMPNGMVDFDGTLVLSPGMCINVVSTITQSTDIIVANWLWSEWLL